MELKETFQKVKAASKTLGLLTDEQRNEILQAVADAIIAETPALLAANAEDLAKMDKANPLYDRLQLTEQRLQDIASDMRHVSTLPSPLGRVLKDKTLENGLETRQYTALTARKSSQRQDARKWFASAASSRSIRSYRHDLRGSS